VRQQPIPITYEDVRIDTGFRADLIVQNKVIVEIKWVWLFWNDAQLMSNE